MRAMFRCLLLSLCKKDKIIGIFAFVPSPRQLFTKAAAIVATVVVVRVSKLVVNLRKVSNRAHPSSFLSTPFLLLINHHDRNAAYTLDEEVNCNYQSLSLLGPTLLLSIHSPLSSRLP